MHICLCSDEFPPDTAWGGIATYVAEAANALRRLGHRVTVISLAANGRDRIGRAGHVPVIRLGVGAAARSNLLRAIAFPLRCACQLRRMSRKSQRPDIVEYPDWLGQGILRAGLPSVIRLHATAGVLIRRGDLAPGFDYRLVARLEAAALRPPAALLANSRRSAYEARTAFRIPESRPIGVIPCLVDTETFKPACRSKRNTSLLFVGRLDRAKGAPTLFRALGVLVRRFPDLRCVVVGGGFGDDADADFRFRERAAWLAQDPEVAKAVTFVGQVPRDNLTALYQEASVVVIPSLFESFGYVALEGMACGRPVVLSAECGIAELIQDGVTASIVPAEDDAALADRITDLLRDRAMADTIGRNARELVLARCSETAVALQLINFYHGQTTCQDPGPR